VRLSFITVLLLVLLPVAAVVCCDGLPLLGEGISSVEKSKTAPADALGLLLILTVLLAVPGRATDIAEILLLLAVPGRAANSVKSSGFSSPVAVAAAAKLAGQVPASSTKAPGAAPALLVGTAWPRAGKSSEVSCAGAAPLVLLVAA
jgi:hypothetical protein